jgi:hypothetical protein
MNWDQVEGNWKQLRGRAKEQWGKLTDDEIDQISGRREQLAVRIRASRSPRCSPLTIATSRYSHPRV